MAAEPADLSVRPASLARRRDLRPKHRTAPTSKAKAVTATAAEATPVDPGLTRTAVEALPAIVSWPLDQASVSRLPIIHDGQRWHCIGADTSQHVVICGASRSGKGNLLQILALTMLAQGPERAAVWVLDPKGGLDYQELRLLAHARVYADVLTESNPFDGDLGAGYQAALAELGRRNELMLSVGARNHHEYRKYRAQLRQPSDLPPLPILVLICDEVAELNGAQQKALATLARMSAAAGMVIWAATQYPTVESLPSQVQANALVRVVFQFPSPRYTAVALGLAPGERPKWEPSAIGERGVAILRQDGRDVAIGRVHHLVDETARTILRALRSRYPRTPRRQDAGAIAPAPQQEAAAAPAPEVATTSTPLVAALLETPVSAEIGPVEGGGAGISGAPESSVPEKDRKESLVVRLAAEGWSQSKIREELVTQFGSALGQARLVELYREGRAQAAQQPDAESPAAEPVKGEDSGAAQGGTAPADVSGLSLSPGKLAAAA